jgi:glycosyltransferase involved in cell wall biosynthesis
MVTALVHYGLRVIVVDDGSGAPCVTVLNALQARYPETMDLVRLPTNQGKGAAVAAGLRRAHTQGFSHALQIDADGQHDVADVPKFLRACEDYPQAVIYGQPRYDASVPKLRLYARYLTHVWVWINTLSLDIRDSMCGYRIYPLATVVSLLDRVALGRRMDFDPEVLVRLHWQGVPLVGIATKVGYPIGGVSHFKLVVDNALLAAMHARLLLGMLRRLPCLLRRKARW